MILLDTDVFTILTRSSSVQQSPALIWNLQRTTEDICISAVTVEEVMRGALALIRKEETRGSGTEGYALLVRLLVAISGYRVLPYDDAADRIYRGFGAAVRRSGAADCKIAAVAHVHDAVVITPNLRHFSAIPGIRMADWTQEPNPSHHEAED